MSRVIDPWRRLSARAGAALGQGGIAPVIGIGIFLAFAAVVLSSCGGGGKPASVSPEATPTTVPATPTPEPTPEPTPTPEALSGEEIAARIDEVVQLVNGVADAYPGSQFLATIRSDAQTASASYDDVVRTQDYGSVLTPLNGLGNVGHDIGQFACFGNEGSGEPETQAWLAIRNLVLEAGQKYEDMGFLELGMTQTFRGAFFKVPEGCANRTLLSSDD